MKKLNDQSALLLIDLQNDFCPPRGKLTVKDGEMTIAVANEMMPYFRGRVYASKDHHPASHKSFASSHLGKKVGDIIDLHGVTQFLWPDHCVQGSDGAEFHPELDCSQVSHITYKGENPEVDSYSAFYDNDKSSATDLHEELLKHSIKTLFVMGLATDYCLKFSVLDALSLGYEVYILFDGCRAVNIHQDDEVHAIEEMKKAGAKIISSSSIKRSFLDVDSYKFTMGEALYFKDKDAIGEYLLACRSDVDLRPFYDEIKEEILLLDGVRFTKDDSDYLYSTSHLSKEFIDYLNEHAELRSNDISIAKSENNLVIRASGNIVRNTIYWETILTGIVNEVYVRNQYGHRKPLAEEKLRKNLQILKDENIVIHLAEFGSRRRESYLWQKRVNEILIKSDMVDFLGTSNVSIARELGVPHIGTMAHEYFQMWQAMSENIKDFQFNALKFWADHYKENYSTCLTDILGVKSFLYDIGPNLLKRYQGFRHDSGDPIAWAKMMLAAFKRSGIDPKTKTLLFSDGLSFSKIVEIVKNLKDCKAKLVFGVGTKLTNDLEDHYKALSVVMKLVRFNGKPVAKLSDEANKTMCEDQHFLAQLHKMKKDKEEHFELWMGKNRIKDYQQLARSISSWIEERARLAHADSLVVGISGGVDSAVVAAIASMTSLPVHGVKIPCSSSPEHVGRAEEVIKRFSLHSHHINLDDSFESIISQVDLTLIDTEKKSRSCYGALRSCLRAPVLDFVGKVHNGIIVGTGNRDEDGLIRYFQKRGDGSVDISPIADLFKREIFEMAKVLKVPHSIIDATPSADLWGQGSVEQTDEEELGFRYADVEFTDRLARKLNVGVEGLIQRLTESDYDVNPDLHDIIKKIVQMESQTRHKENPNLPVYRLSEDFLISV